MLRQLRELKTRAEAAEAARDLAEARAEAAAQQSREDGGRAAMARERLRQNEASHSETALSLERLQTTIRVMHAQLLRWSQV